MCSEDMDERDVEVKGTGRVEPSALQMDGVSKSPSQDSIFNVQHLRYPYTFRKKLPTWADVKVPSEINRLLDCSRELTILVLTDDHG